MKIFKAKYKGGDKILNFSTTSTKAAYNAFLKQGEPQEIEVEVFDGESWTTFDEHIKNRSSIMNERPSSIESEVARQKEDCERIESKHDKNERPLSIESAVARQEEFLSKVKSENSEIEESDEEIPVSDSAKNPLNFDVSENIFYIFEHPLKQPQVVNTSNFSWLGFWFTLFYLLYHKAWKDATSRDWLWMTIAGGLFAEFTRLIDGGKGPGTIVSIALWLSVYIGIGFVGNRVKAKNLLREGYEVVDKIEAASKNMALAEFEKRRVNNNPPTLSSIDENQDGQVSRSSSSEAQSADKLSGVAGEIESFANLRDKGIITQDEFEQKKKQLLNL